MKVDEKTAQLRLCVNVSCQFGEGAMDCLVKFGPRVKKVMVEFEEPFTLKHCLERAIRRLMESDPYMRQHSSSGFFMTYCDSSGRQDVEIDDDTEQWDIDRAIPIQLMLFDSIQLEIPTMPDPRSAVPSSPALTIPPAAKMYLDRIGMTIYKDPAPSSSVSQTSNCSRRDKQNRPGVKSTPQDLSKNRKPSADAGSDHSDDEYGAAARKQMEENRARLEALVPKEVPKLRPGKKQSNMKGNKENVAPRVLPSRAAKNKKAPEPIHEEEEIEEIECEENSGPVSTNNNNRKKIVKINTVGHFHKAKNHRLIGRTITKYTPLPDFPRALKSCLQKGDYNTQLMNDFLKEHVENVTVDSKITREEYKTLSDQVKNRLKSMNFKNAHLYTVHIRKQLSDSLRAKRHYNKKKERRAAKSAKKKSSEQTEEDQIVDQGAPGAGESDEGDTDKADDVLQKPVVNKSSIKMCISASTKRIPFIKSHTVEQVLLKYPYLKEADLLIYEYSSRVPLPLNTLMENFQNSLLSLSHILDEPLPEIDDERGRVHLYFCIEKFFSGEGEHLPSIQFCDAANKNAVPLNDIPYGMAPAVVIVQDGSKVIQSASLIFDGSVLTTAQNPTAFDCVALLLSGYWVFHIDYPAPYKHHMKIFETILHGNVNEAARPTRYPKVDEFLRKLIIASKF